MVSAQPDLVQEYKHCTDTSEAFILRSMTMLMSDRVIVRLLPQSLERREGAQLRLDQPARLHQLLQPVLQLLQPVLQPGRDALTRAAEALTQPSTASARRVSMPAPSAWAAAVISSK
ncbi:hypothetical protein ABTX71_34035 [Streptomyces parvulus]|uniref:hypothetical protein n=1 Tax=Streptomyces parvulus TaxID=146923 RepID=UPI003328A453